MKKIYAFALAALIAGGAQASTEWEISGTKFRVDTLYFANVGPGTTQTEIRMTCLAEGNNYVNKIYYTTVDLKNENIEMRVVKGKDHMGLKETVPAMAERKTTDNAVYFAGVNGDFFGTYPINLCVSQGALTNYRAIGSDIEHPAALLIGENNEPVIASELTEPYAHNIWYPLDPKADTIGVATFPNGQSFKFDINVQRGANRMVLYSPQWQFNTFDVGYTGQNEWGSEVQIRPVSGKAMFGSTIECEVICTPTPMYNKNMKIPADGYVLSGTSDAYTLIMTLKVGDKVKIYHPLKADDNDVVAREIIGGFPVILKDGEILSRPSYPEHLSSRQPRTAVGYNKDKTKLIMLVVDGRNKGISEGVYSHILGGVMKNLGCVDAMNFDGGGSSTSYIRGLGRRNLPDPKSPNYTRPVVNGLFAVSVAPKDEVVASIEIADKKINLTTDSVYTPVVYAYNQYGVLIDANVKDFKIIASPEVGTVTGTSFKAGSGKYTTELIVSYNGFTYTVPMYINGGGKYVSEVTEITTEDINAVPEYFTLQGIKVQNPEQGQIMIVRRGSKVSKEIIK